MRKLWCDIRAHRRTSVLFLVYLLVAMVVFFSVRTGPPTAVVCFTTPFIAGALTGWWRHTWGSQIRGGMLAGTLATEAAVLWIVLDQLRGYILHGHNFGMGEIVEFAIAGGIIGIVFGLFGALSAKVLRLVYTDK